MNNSKIALDAFEEEPEFDRNPQLQKQRAKLTNIVQAIEGVTATKDWQTIKREIFDPAAEQLDILLAKEMKKRPIEPAQIYFLQGQLRWTEKRANLEKLNEQFKVELKHINEQLNG